MGACLLGHVNFWKCAAVAEVLGFARHIALPLQVQRNARAADARNSLKKGGGGTNKAAVHLQPVCKPRFLGCARERSAHFLGTTGPRVVEMSSAVVRVGAGIALRSEAIFEPALLYYILVLSSTAKKCAF
jgi:hypothetical protein